MWIWQHQILEEGCPRWARVPIAEEEEAVLKMDTIGLGKGRVTRSVCTDDAHGDAYLAGQSNHIQFLKPEGLVHASGMEFVIFPFPRRKVLPYCLQPMSL